MSIAPPRVSVVVPFFKTPLEFIREGVESVFAQSYGSWELILVDDGAPLEISLVAQQLAHEQPGKVRYLEHPGRTNRGQSATRNLGIRHARGEYIAFLDADDMWFPEKLAQQVALLDAYPEAAMVYGRSTCWYSWSGDSADARRDFTPRLGVKADTVYSPPALLARFISVTAWVPCPSSALVRRSAVEHVGGFEDSFRGIYEDQVFFSKICLVHSVLVAAACWDRYRQHTYSVTTATGRGAQAKARADYLNWLATYFTEHCVRDEVLIRALQKQMLPLTDVSWLSLERYAEYVQRRITKVAFRVVNRVVGASLWLRGGTSS